MTGLSSKSGLSVKIVDLNLTNSDLQFVPNTGLLLNIQNASIALTLHRQVFYWIV